jgi:cell division protein FtsL
MRVVNMILGVLLVGLVVLNFGLKHKVREMEREAGAKARMIAEHTAALGVLRAELSYLSRPERLELMARDRLGLQPAAPDQVVTYGEFMGVEKTGR